MQRGRAVTWLTWDRAAAVVLLVFAAYIIAAARVLGLTLRGVPGPGFAPLWIGVALGIAAIAVLVESRSRLPRADADAETPTASPWWPAAATIAAVALIPRVGMLAALAVMLLVQVRYLGGTWRTSALTAVVLPLALTLVFGMWLKVPLPKGPWGF